MECTILIIPHDDPNESTSINSLQRYSCTARNQFRYLDDPAQSHSLSSPVRKQRAMHCIHSFRNHHKIKYSSQLEPTKLRLRHPTAFIYRLYTGRPSKADSPEFYDDLRPQARTTWLQKSTNRIPTVIRTIHFLFPIMVFLTVECSFSFTMSINADDRTPRVNSGVIPWRARKGETWRIIVLDEGGRRRSVL